MQLFPSTLTPAFYVSRAPITWINYDTSAPTLLALRTMLTSTQSASSSKLSSRQRSQQRMVLRTLPILTAAQMSVCMFPYPMKPSWRFSFHSDTEESDFSGFSASEDSVTVGVAVIAPFTWAVQSVCTDVFWCILFYVSLFTAKVFVNVGFFPRLSPTFNFPCLFLLLLSSAFALI